MELHMNAPATPAHWLTTIIHYAAGIDLFPVEDTVFLEPHRLRSSLEAALVDTAGRVRIAGALDRRLAFIERTDGRWVVGDLSGLPHNSRAWPAWACGRIKLDTPGSWLSLATLSEPAVYRLSRPAVLLAALYHPEYFPLPRFPLGAADHGTTVLINKPLAQGLLTSKYDPAHPPRFGPGDHRLRKAWFTPQALRIIHDGLQPVRDRFGASPADLAPVMLAYCLHRASNAAVLVGFTTPEQVRQNLTPPARPLTSDDVAFIRDTVSTLQRRLDAAGEVFLDERQGAQP